LGKAYAYFVVRKVGVAAPILLLDEFHSQLAIKCFNGKGLLNVVVAQFLDLVFVVNPVPYQVMENLSHWKTPMQELFLENLAKQILAELMDYNFREHEEIPMHEPNRFCNGYRIIAILDHKNSAHQTVMVKIGRDKLFALS
jgi:hypothetical protein